MILCILCKETWSNFNKEEILNHYKSIHDRDLSNYPYYSISEHFVTNSEYDKVNYEIKRFIIYLIGFSILLPVIWDFYDWVNQTINFDIISYFFYTTLLVLALFILNNAIKKGKI